MIRSIPTGGASLDCYSEVSYAGCNEAAEAVGIRILPGVRVATAPDLVEVLAMTNRTLTARWFIALHHTGPTA